MTKEIEFLIKRKIPLDFQDSPGGNTALHEAAYQCERGKEIYKMLIAAGASQKIKNTKGQTAIKSLTFCKTH